MSQEEINLIADRIAAQSSICHKEVLTLDEAARYMGISKSYLYRLTHERRIPHSKPAGKMVFFRRDELEAWLQQNRVATIDDINKEAAERCLGSRRKDK